MQAVVLVVDDSMLIRHTVCRFLEQRGFSVEAATNGQDAVDTLKRVVPDLIITDMQMPKMRRQAFRSSSLPANRAASNIRRKDTISRFLKT